MRQSGEEKKLEALFRELKKADETAAPSFAHAFAKAEAKAGTTKMRTVRPALAAVSLLIVAAVFFVWFSQTQEQNASEANELFSEETAPAPFIAETKPDDAADEKINVPPVEKRSFAKTSLYVRQNRGEIQAVSFRANLVRRAKPQRKKIRREIFLARDLMAWKSPTESLLETPFQKLLKPVIFVEIVTKNNLKNRGKENEK